MDPDTVASSDDDSSVGKLSSKPNNLLVDDAPTLQVLHLPSFESLQELVRLHHMLARLFLCRICTADKGRPIVISNRIIEEYAKPNVNTRVYKKNLFSLGEDRFLAGTLSMKHFPTFKAKFCPGAVAHRGAQALAYPCLTASSVDQFDCS